MSNSVVECGTPRLGGNSGGAPTYHGRVDVAAQVGRAVSQRSTRTSARPVDRRRQLTVADDGNHPRRCSSSSAAATGKSFLGHSDGPARSDEDYVVPVSQPCVGMRLGEAQGVPRSPLSSSSRLLGTGLVSRRRQLLSPSMTKTDRRQARRSRAAEAQPQVLAKIFHAERGNGSAGDGKTPRRKRDAFSVGVPALLLSGVVKGSPAAAGRQSSSRPRTPQEHLALTLRDSGTVDQPDSPRGAKRSSEAVTPESQAALQVKRRAAQAATDALLAFYENTFAVWNRRIRAIDACHNGSDVPKKLAVADSIFVQRVWRRLLEYRDQLDVAEQWLCDPLLAPRCESPAAHDTEWLNYASNAAAAIGAISEATDALLQVVSQLPGNSTTNSRAGSKAVRPSPCDVTRCSASGRFGGRGRERSLSSGLLEPQPRRHSEASSGRLGTSREDSPTIPGIHRGSGWRSPYVSLYDSGSFSRHTSVSHILPGRSSRLGGSSRDNDTPRSTDTWDLKVVPLGVSHRSQVRPGGAGSAARSNWMSSKGSMNSGSSNWDTPTNSRVGVGEVWDISQMPRTFKEIAEMRKRVSQEPSRTRYRDLRVPFGGAGEDRTSIGRNTPIGATSSAARSRSGSAAAYGIVRRSLSEVGSKDRIRSSRSGSQAKATSSTAAVTALDPAVRRNLLEQICSIELSSAGLTPSQLQMAQKSFEQLYGDEQGTMMFKKWVLDLEREAVRTGGP